jgi:hypothetical protein
LSRKALKKQVNAVCKHFFSFFRFRKGHKSQFLILFPIPSSLLTCMTSFILLYFKETYVLSQRLCILQRIDNP